MTNNFYRTAARDGWVWLWLIVATVTLSMSLPATAKLIAVFASDPLHQLGIVAIYEVFAVVLKLIPGFTTIKRPAVIVSNLVCAAMLSITIPANYQLALSTAINNLHLTVAPDWAYAGAIATGAAVPLFLFAALSLLAARLKVLREGTPVDYEHVFATEMTAIYRDHQRQFLAQQRHALALSMPVAPLALPKSEPLALSTGGSEATVNDESTLSNNSAPTVNGESRTARVKTLASERGVSEATIWRKLK